MFNPWLILGAFLAISVAFGGVYFKGRSDGYASCEATQKAAQESHVAKVTKTFKKVDHEAPVNADRRTRSEWMRKNARGD